jgi:hypothetical protein
MTSSQVLLALPLAVAAIIGGVIGCGGGSGPTDDTTVRLNSARSVALTRSPGISANDYRWLDIASNLFAAGFGASFDYAAAPTVIVTFDDGTDTLQGTISATALKPNFAYQIKLVGKPPGVWGANGDAAANEQIGRVGRWWSEASGNVNDAYYEAHHLTETITGYLVLGFLITDETGRAEVTWRLENSYHVLWNTNQRASGPNDRPAQTRTLAYSDWGYSLPYPASASETIYPEQEPGRPLPGTARLPAGRFRCLFALYEESFHDVPDGAGPGGSWANAMQFADLDFDVLAP